jgi:hypothetical protein
MALANIHRLKSFVILDVLVTLPCFTFAAYDTFVHPASDGFVKWLRLVVLGCVLTGMFPSLVCMVGKVLPQVIATTLIVLYLAFTLVVTLNLLHDLHGPLWLSFARVGIILLIAKSIYGVCCHQTT